MRFDVIDADGHVTETWEQIAKHLEEPYRRRPLLTPFFPQDGWDRRLIGTKGNWAGDARAWEEALDAGGMAVSVLFPTLGPVLPWPLTADHRDPQVPVVADQAAALALHANGAKWPLFRPDVPSQSMPKACMWPREAFASASRDAAG